MIHSWKGFFYEGDNFINKPKQAAVN